MALITYAKSTIYQLPDELAALHAADALESSDRAAAVLAEENARIAAVQAEIDARILAVANEVIARDAAVKVETDARILAVANEVIARDAAVKVETDARILAVANEVIARDAAVKVETDARVLADQAISDALSAHISGPFSTAKSLLDLVNGDASVTGSFRKAIDDVIGGAPAALDTLKEIADYIAVNPDANVAAAITSHIDAAIALMKGSVTTAMDTLGEIETAVNNEAATRSTLYTSLDTKIADETADRIAAMLSEITARNAAIKVEEDARLLSEAALLASMQTYANSSSAQGGSVPKLEYVLVNNNSITLSQTPKSGVNGIVNFGTVRFTDPVTKVSYDAPVISDAGDVTGKTFTVSTDTSGQWHNNSVAVQYFYVAV